MLKKSSNLVNGLNTCHNLRISDLCNLMVSTLDHKIMNSATLDSKDMKYQMFSLLQK